MFRPLKSYYGKPKFVLLQPYLEINLVHGNLQIFGVIFDLKQKSSKLSNHE